uniref:Nephronectin-like n=1 Tax=Gouania willdenowi TaxID=441366 RepID=A0A8C5DTR3_GOUWI
MLLLVPGRYYRHTLIVWICVWTQNGWTQGTEPSKGLCRHDNSVECCWGWRQTEWGRCQPLCQQGCKHGVCVGADRCQCHSGYTGKACNHDVNECGLKPRPCKHRCVNTSGSFKCFCMNGFTLESDGSCRNARTCYHANCQYGCEVMKGAVRCTCPSPGLRLGPDQRTCVGRCVCCVYFRVCCAVLCVFHVTCSFVCPRRRKCVNTFGSYLCTCHLGFRLVYVNRRYTCVTTITITPVTMSTPATTTKPVTTARPVTTTTTVTTTTAVTTGTMVPTMVATTPTMVPTTTPVTTTTLVTTTTMVPTTTTTATTPPAVNDATTITTTTEASSVARCMTTTTAVTMTTTVTPVTTTISNRIGKDVTHKQRGDFSCGFEHGLCDWISDGDGDLHWDVVVRPAGGRYLSVPELKAGQSSIRGARLVIHIPMFRGGALCFSFSHWLTGHHVGVLQLFVRRKGHNQRYGSALWSRTGGYGWRNTQVTMTTNSLDRVRHLTTPSNPTLRLQQHTHTHTHTHTY